MEPLILRTLLLATVIIAGTAATFPGAGRTAPPQGRRAASAVGARFGAPPAVVEHGSDVIFFPYAYNDPCGDYSRFAFAPDGNAYSVDGCPFATTLLRISPDGTFATLPFPKTNKIQDIIFARNALWFATNEGIVRTDTDGSHRKEYRLAGGDDHVFFGGDGAIYGSRFRSAYIDRIDLRGTITSYPNVL